LRFTGATNEVCRDRHGRAFFFENPDRPRGEQPPPSTEARGPLIAFEPFTHVGPAPAHTSPPLPYLPSQETLSPEAGPVKPVVYDAGVLIAARYRGAPFEGCEYLLIA
jgi:hypothetical protein